MSGGGRPDDVSDPASFPEISAFSVSSGVASLEPGLSRRFRHDSWNQSYGKQNTYLRTQRIHEAYLTRKTLYHSLFLFLRIIGPSTSAEGAPEVVVIIVLKVFFLGRLVQRARMGQCACRTVAPKMAFWKELYLLMICMACDRAR